jgi:ABC-type transport system involved in multi-copper enzyme maturation permease subunit
MIRTIIWKEWRENRGKYLTLWLVFNLPILLLSIMLGLVRAARTPFADLSNQTILKYLPIPLFESALIVSLFLFATGFLGVTTFLPEVEDKSLFFAFEQPVARWRYAVAKLLNGAAHVALAVVVSSLIAPAAVYGMMLAGGKVTAAGSAAAFGVVMAAALRAGLWCALVSIAAFAGAALIGSLVPRWWLATASMLVYIFFFVNYVMDDNRFFNGENFFDMFADAAPGTQNVSASFGNWNWLTVTGSFPLPRGFAHWHLLPTITPLFLLCLFAAMLAFVFQRKELH